MQVKIYCILQTKNTKLHFKSRMDLQAVRPLVFKSRRMLIKFNNLRGKNSLIQLYKYYSETDVANRHYVIKSVSVFPVINEIYLCSMIFFI